MIRRHTPLTAALSSAGFAAVLAYFVIVGGSAFGEVLPVLLLVNAVIASCLVAAYAFGLWQGADTVDRFVVGALLVFVVAAIFSKFPRQSLDAALGALAYAAAFFVIRGLMASERLRMMAFRSLMALSLFFTLVFTARWVPLVLEWWALTNWSVVPPLDLDLSASPWGHRHDAALVVALLYPSWWMDRPTKLRKVIAAVVGVLAAVIVIVDGSRTLWLAFAVATAVIALPPALRAFRSDARVRIAVLMACALAIAIAIPTGLAGSLLERISTVTTLSARTAMWGALTDLWSANPLVGVGPGSFPWVLQLTDYFDVNSWAPRHPDSLLFQLLPEAGLAGVVATVVVAAALAPRIVRAAAPAKWALVAFAVAGIGANPTDLGFLVAVAIVWAAIAAPRLAVPRLPNPVRWMRIATNSALGLIGVAYGTTLVAAFSYADAREQIHRGDLSESASALSMAVNLDPGMALYVRQRGTLYLVAGAHADAQRLLSRATELNPSDDLAWRTLAAAHWAADSDKEAQAAILRAVDIQRSDATNLLFLAHQQRVAGDPEAAATIAEIVQAWPSISSAPGWRDFLPHSLTPTEAVELAIRRWESGLESPGPFTSQSLALAAIGARFDLDPEAIERSRLSPDLARTTLAVYRCDGEADARIAEASAAERRTHEYWGLVVTRASQRGVEAKDAVRLIEIMTGGSVRQDRMTETLSVLAENNPSGFSADVWGYRRLPIHWPRIEPVLPSPRAGGAVWRLAAAESGDAAISC